MNSAEQNQLDEIIRTVVADRLDGCLCGSCITAAVGQQAQDARLQVSRRDIDARVMDTLWNGSPAPTVHSIRRTIHGRTRTASGDPA